MRDELRQLLPARYTVAAGVASDRNGLTAGDVDVVIHNDQWFPRIKAGAADESRRVHYAIEAIYAVGEVKQTLDYRTLDEALEKLVVCHRLNRPATSRTRLTENRKLDDCEHGTSNPLYSFIFAVQLGQRVSFQEVVERWFAISKSLRRDEVVRAICVLDQGFATWMRHQGDAALWPATFMDDQYEPIVPAFCTAQKAGSALYAFATSLLGHLNSSVLAPEDIGAYYGNGSWPGSAPNDSSVCLPGRPFLILPQFRDKSTHYG